MSTSLHLLKSTKTSKPAKRLGRGPGSGKGKTSGRGHKGYLARSGSSKRLGFEGGQMQLMWRIPKLKGFKRPKINVDKIFEINLKNIEKYITDGKLTKVQLLEKKIIGKYDKVKILGDGEISAKVEVEVDGVTKSAREKIEKAGGNIIIIAKR